MTYEMQTEHHEVAAAREQEAAARATSEEAARRHNVLATMHRNQAAKMKAITLTLDLAFGS